MEKSKNIYRNEICPVCKIRACETQNAAYIIMIRCEHIEKEDIYSFYCNKTGCCHGCQCFIRRSCTLSPSCRCDCHSKLITTLENKETPIKTQLLFEKVKLQQHKI